jgi:hypothetical protein
MLKFIDKPVPLKGKLLIINAISAGFVPTYALDTLIVNNHFQRVAYLTSDLLEPSVGYLPSNIENGALGLPAELYLQGDVAILQLRTYVCFGHKKDFAKEIAALAKEH